MSRVYEQAVTRKGSLRFKTSVSGPWTFSMWAHQITEAHLKTILYPRLAEATRNGLHGQSTCRKTTVSRIK